MATTSSVEVISVLGICGGNPNDTRTFQNKTKRHPNVIKYNNKTPTKFVKKKRPKRTNVKPKDNKMNESKTERHLNETKYRHPKTQK